MSGQTNAFAKDLQFWKFRGYGFLKNLRFFDPFLILFFREAGLSFLAIGTLISIREITTNILEIPTGILADMFGRRKAMLLGFGSYIASFILYYIGSRYWVFALAMVMFAVGETFRSGTHKAMILEHLKITGHESSKVAYYGKTRAASQFGSAICALLAAGLVFWTGSFRIVFLASTVPYVLDFLLLASYPKALDGTHNRGSGVRGWQQLQRRFTATIQGLWQLLRDPCTLRALLSSASFDALFKATKDYLQPILQAQALALPLLLGLGGEQRTALLVGGVYFVIYLGTSLASASAGGFQRRVRSLARGINLTLVVGVSVLLLGGIGAHFDINGVAIGAFLAVFVLQNLRRPMLVGYLADRMAHCSMASGLSVEAQLRTLLIAVFAPGLGWLADRLDVGLAVAAASACILLALPVLIARDD